MTLILTSLLYFGLGSESSHGQNPREIARQVKSCAVTTDDQKAVQKNLVESIGSASVRTQFCSCRDYSKSFITSFNERVLGAELSQFQDLISDQITLNIVDQYYYLAHRFDLATRSKKQILDELCYGNACTAQKRKLISKRLEDLQKVSVTKVNLNLLGQQINEGIDRANQKLKLVRAGVDEGYVYDAPKDSARLRYELKGKRSSRPQNLSYFQAYVDILKIPDGFLILSDSLKKQIGDLRDLERDAVKSDDGKSYGFEPHKTIPKGKMVQILSRAARETALKIRDEASALHFMDNQKHVQESGYSRQQSRVRNIQETERDLIRLMKTNPVAVAQILIRNPEKVPLICNLLGLMKTYEEEDQKWNKVFVTGGLFLTGLMITSGVGAAGLPAMASWLGLGAQSAATVSGFLGSSAVLASLSVMGGGLGIAGALSSAGSAYQASSELQSIETAIVTNNAPAELKNRASRALRTLEAAQSDALWSGIGVATDLMGLRAAYNAKSVVGVLEQRAKTVDAISEIDKAQTIRSTIKASGDNGTLRVLSRISNEQQRRQLVQILADNPGKINEFAREAKIALEKCPPTGPCQALDEIVSNFLAGRLTPNGRIYLLPKHREMVEEIASRTAPERLQKALIEAPSIEGRGDGFMDLRQFSVDGKTYFGKIIPVKPTNVEPVLNLKGRKVAVSHVRNEVIWAEEMDRLGLGPKFYGAMQMPSGHYALIYEHVDGIHAGLSHWPDTGVTLEHIQSLRKLGRELSARGIYPRDLQVRLTPDGRAVVIDSELFRKTNPGDPKVIRLVDEMVSNIEATTLPDRLSKVVGLKDDEKEMLMNAYATLKLQKRKDFVESVQCIPPAQLRQLAVELARGPGSQNGLRETTVQWLLNNPCH